MGRVNKGMGRSALAGILFVIVQPSLLGVQLDHFAFAPIPTPQTSAVPFSVSITACDSNGVILANFSNAAMLSGAGDHGGVLLTPITTAPFQNGQWTGAVMIAAANPDTNIRLVCSSNGVTGLSNPFNAVPIAIQQFNLTAADLIYDSFAKRIYLTVPSSAPTFSNSLVVIDPYIGQIETSYYLGDNPGRMALSDDGQFLYLGFYGSNVFRRFNLTSHKVDIQASLGSHTYYTWLQYYASDMAVLPGHPHSVAIAENTGYGAGAQVVVFDDGVPRTNLLTGVLASYSGTVVATSSTRLYAGTPFTRLSLDESGVISSDSYDGLVGLSDLIKYQEGLVFTPGGNVFNPETLVVLGNLPACSIVEPDLTTGRVFTMSSQPILGQPAAWTLNACDPISLQIVGSLAVPGVNDGGPTAFVRWGTNGIAFCISSWYQNQVFLVRTSLVPSGPPAELSISAAADQSPAILYSNLTYSIQITNNGLNNAQTTTFLDVIPAGSTFVSATSTLGSCVYSNAMITCNLGTFGNGLGATITLTVTPNIIGPLTNMAVVSSLSLDTVISNNTAITVVTCQHAPFAVTQRPWLLNQTNMTLNGMAVPNGLSSTAWFEWGVGSNYDQMTFMTNLGTGSAVVRLSAPIGTLTNGIVYQFHLVVSNALGIVYGGTKLFTTGRKITAWGDNSSGQTAIPTGLSNVLSLAAGRYHSLALGTDGKVVAWGANTYGQTNVPISLRNAVAIAAGDSDALALTSDGIVVAWGQSYAGQANIPGGLNGVVAVSQGVGHDIALKADGTVTLWGDNAFGQNSQPQGLSNVVAIAAGLYHSVALRADGIVLCWGNNANGQTNVPVGLGHVIDIAAGSGYSMALKADGTAVAWGSVGVGQGISNIVAIAANNFNGLLLKSDGTVTDVSGQVAGPANLSNSSIIAAGVSHSLADGNNIPPQAQSQIVESPASQDLTITLNATDSNGDALSYRFAVLPLAGKLYQFTNGIRGPAIVTPDTVVSDPGHRAIFAPDINGSGKPYANFSFLVNDGEADSALAMVILNIGNTYAHTQPATQITQTNATLDGMTLANGLASMAWFEWGERGSYNNTTSLLNVGAGSTVVRLNQGIVGLTPGGVYQYRLVVSNVAGVVYGAPKIFTTGRKVTAWGNALYGLNSVPVGLSNVVAVGAGTYHQLALKSDGKVVAWGDTVSGKTTVPASATNVIAIAGGSDHSIALKADGTVVVWGSNNFGQRNIPSGLSNVVGIAAGLFHNLALKSDGTVVGWGWNVYGQATVPAGLSNVVAVAAGQTHSLVLRADGSILTWGNSSYGLASAPAGATNVIAIAAGDFHSVVLKQDGTILVWGSDDQGQTDLPANLGTVIGISSGVYQSFALQADGKLIAWGLNSSGQTTVPLGLNNVVSAAGTVGDSIVVGGNLPPQVTSQLLTCPANRDLVAILGGTDANGDRLTFRIALPPLAGTLYQYTNGTRGPAIVAVDTSVNDTNRRVIYAPGLNGFGSPYTTFNFAANDGETDSAAALVTVNVAPPIAPVLTGVIQQTNGSFQLKFSGDSNTVYAVWASTNLTDWILLDPANSMSNGLFQYVDLKTTNWFQRFYKAGAVQ
jgi:uncharacterized repeat protein (TIGR01451 family)